MKEMIVGKHHTDLIGIKKIVNGIRNPVYNEATGLTTITGGGEILWDVSGDREKPYFLLAFKNRRS